MRDPPRKPGGMLEATSELHVDVDVLLVGKMGRRSGPTENHKRAPEKQASEPQAVATAPIPRSRTR